MADELKHRGSRARVIFLKCIDARFVLSDGERGHLEEEAVPIVEGVPGLLHVAALTVGARARREAAIDVELHLDGSFRARGVDDPPGSLTRVGAVERASEV